jgi:hypothetical protein
LNVVVAEHTGGFVIVNVPLKLLSVTPPIVTVSPTFKPCTVGHCLAHARRHVVEVASSFPAECRHILETLGTVYRHDAEAREQRLLPGDGARGGSEIVRRPLPERYAACRKHTVTREILRSAAAMASAIPQFPVHLSSTLV